ncbi:MAG: GNAT family N-acetyltransferase [Chitinophagaceae bacterium]|nr:GNAT family N-acetyltransferase [Chitinophagaceae bacterium]
MKFIIANSEDDYRVAALLFKEYAAWLNIDLGFQQFEDELKHIQTVYAAVTGGIVLCKAGDVFIACAGIRKISNEIAELKRMFVRTDFQQQGIGKILLQKAITLAGECGYSCIRLDTLDDMEPAIKLYNQFGFYQIPAYYHNPDERSLYFEKKI